LITGAIASARAQEADWQKSYPVSGKASITVSTGDTSTEVRSCGACREVHVRVEWNDRRPDEYVINEFQSGNHVNFDLKEKSHFLHFDVGNRHSPRVTVETPSSVDLEARTADGSLKVSGVEGNVELHSGDGSVDVSDVSGAVRLNASDGSIRIHNVSGTLESRTSDGSVSIDGRFTGLQVHNGDGRLDVTLADGSKLTSSSRIESSDGRVTVKLPKTLAVDASTATFRSRWTATTPSRVQGMSCVGALITADRRLLFTPATEM
jgi:hypothetical protein